MHCLQHQPQLKEVSFVPGVSKLHSLDDVHQVRELALSASHTPTFAIFFFDEYILANSNAAFVYRFIADTLTGSTSYISLLSTMPKDSSR